VGGERNSFGVRREVDSIEDVHMDYELVGCAAGSKSEDD
jgi:hypothetical protein